VTPIFDHNKLKTIENQPLKMLLKLNESCIVKILTNSIIMEFFFLRNSWPYLETIVLFSCFFFPSPDFFFGRIVSKNM